MEPNDAGDGWLYLDVDNYPKNVGLSEQVKIGEYGQTEFYVDSWACYMNGKIREYDANGRTFGDYRFYVLVARSKVSGNEIYCLYDNDYHIILFDAPNPEAFMMKATITLQFDNPFDIRTFARWRLKHE